MIAKFRTTTWWLLPVVVLFFLPACADYQLHYARADRLWMQQSLPTGMPLTHTVYLIGDAGGAPAGGVPPAVRLLGERLTTAGPNTSVVFLGDNLYPDGLEPDDGSPERETDEYRLRVQLDILRDFPGRVFFLAGNHDWYTHGIDGLERQRRFAESYLGRKDIWFPRPGCGDPAEIELSDNLVLILIDSQWWLANWKNHPLINRDCTVKSRTMFKVAMEEAIKGNREKNIIVAMHHPPYTNGPHGGQFTLKQHLFPFTAINENLYIPLPLIGSLYPFLRATVGSKQDVAYPGYQAMRGAILDAARKNGSFIFASGHEHSLQYIEREDQHLIVSGAGSKGSPVRLGKGAAFAYSRPGFAQLDFYEDGSAWVQFWVAGGEDTAGRVVYRRQIRGPLTSPAEKTPRDFTFYQSGADSIDVKLGERDVSRNGLGRLFWGEHYRDAYQSVVRLPVLDLDAYQGGVKPVKRGGGYQTNSLRLETADGREYTMRSLDKDPTRIVPYPLNRSELVLSMVQDAFTGAHPLSATPLPDLQDAVGLYHTNPKLYYVPRQPRLEEFNRDFGDALYLVEERPDGDRWRNQASFGNPRELVSTQSVLKETMKRHDHVIDQRWTLRARLFDVLIGDWDRHDDQWRWARIDSAGRSVYRPVPRDRDQAFSKYDGLMYVLARQIAPATRPLQPFRPYQRQVWWSSFGARYFDPTFLNGLDWPEWARAARSLQSRLGDQTIDRALRENWPEPLHRLDGPELASILKARRDKLPDLARQMYLNYARRVDVVGTHKRDLFEVERRNAEETVVRVYDTNKEGEKEDLFYERTFRRSETNEIRLYGLDDEDIFRIGGEAGRGIRLRLIGGPGEDTFVDHSRVNSLGRKTVVHDIHSEKRSLDVGREARLRLTDNPDYNTYNRFSSDYEFNYWSFLPSITANPDDGLLLGLATTFVHYGYQRKPYAGKHVLNARYALGSSGFEIEHHSEFVDAIGKWDLALDAVFRSPLYAHNFYGIGNETINPEDSLGREFNRVRQREIRLAPALMRISSSNALRIALGPTYESIEVKRNSGRFIDRYADAEDSPLEDDFFEGQHFLGWRFVFDFRNVDDAIFPARGLNVYIDAGYKLSVDDSDIDFPYLEGFVAAFQPLDRRERIVLGTRIGGRRLFSDEFAFYQGATLGGNGPMANLRGLRRDRFVGQAAFYQNIDLRWAIIDSYNRLVPFTMGLFGGFDHGRVWVDDEDSRVWHYSFGGGVFIKPLDMLSAQFSLFRGDTQKWRFLLTGSFLF